MQTNINKYANMRSKMRVLYLATIKNIIFLKILLIFHEIISPLIIKYQKRILILYSLYVLKN